MKRIKFPLKVIKIFMKNQMQNKTYILLDIFNMVSRCLIVFLLYGYVFKINGGSINGISYKTTLWSMFIYFCIMILNIRRLDKIMMDDIKSGNVEMFINKPTNYIFLNFYKCLGQGLYSFIVISLIGSIAMIFFVGIPKLNLAVFIPSFIITFVLGQILGLIIYAIIGVCSFFIQDVRPIHWLVDKMVMVLGGSYLPIAMFPNFMKLAAYYSPLGAINFATSTVYDSWNNEFISRILLQVGWIILFALLLKKLYMEALKKSMINGG